MKKLLAIALLVIVMTGCKKETELTGSSDSGPAENFVVHTYLGYAGYRVAYDTTVNGVYRDTFNYQSPVVFSELDNTEITITSNGAPVVSGHTGSNGEYEVSGLQKGNEYTLTFKSKTFNSNTFGNYHYSGVFKINAKALSPVYHVHLGEGIGRTAGFGSTPTATTNPWAE